MLSRTVINEDRLRSCTSDNRGMFDMLQAIANEISADIGTPYRDFDAIDIALRTGKSPMIYQKPYDMAPLMPIARTIAQQAVSSMMQWIEASYGFQSIILVGGGAFLFKKAVKDAFPKHKIHEVKDPMCANVKIDDGRTNVHAEQPIRIRLRFLERRKRRRKSPDLDRLSRRAAVQTGDATVRRHDQYPVVLSGDRISIEPA